ncbi:MAG: hypothetical protein OEY64_03300 [Nitrospinota bacterium]|nr:hypothetical protein [Nitrospinota bacterium]
MKALEIVAPFDYTLKDEEGKPDATIFRLRGLTSLEYMEVSMLTKMRGEHIVLDHRAMSVTLGYGLAGWSKMKGADGADVPFSKNMTDNLNRLPLDVLTELAVKIFDCSTVSRQDEKN